MNKHIPNILTLSRIASIPVIIGTFYFKDEKLAHQLGTALFLFASFTDYFDGYFARKYNLHSNFGKMLDPIADKVLIGSVIIMLVKFNRADEIPAILILAREFTVAGLREFLGQLKVSLPVSQLAKVKTATQMLALLILMLGSTGSGYLWCNDLGNFCLWIAALLTIITAYSYFKAGLKYTNLEE